MSTARDVRLVRVPGVRAMRRALAALALDGTPLDAAHRIVIVPSAAAAAHLRDTLEGLACVAGWRPPLRWRDALGITAHDHSAAFTLPLMTTRDGWMARVTTDLDLEPLSLDTFAREALMRRAARNADAGPSPAPFAVRPGIVAEMVHFYDGLLRHLRSVDDLERVVGATLEAEADSDRGAARLLAQTRFLVTAFRAFAELTVASGGVDEHAVRARALSGRGMSSISHVILAVADDATEPGGLWPCDFDLLARMDGIARIDVVATDAVLDSGWRERLDARLPGFDEVRLDLAEPMPTLLAPADSDAPYFVLRDREAELDAIARAAKLDAVAGTRSPDDVVVVVQRPLPYVYIARQAFGAAHVPWTASDALPLAAEPVVAAFDLVVSCLFGNYTRADVVGVLASSAFDFGEGAIGPRAAAAFDAFLAQAQYFADRERLATLARTFGDEGDGTRAAVGGVTSEARARVAGAVALLLAALPEIDPPQHMSDYLAALRAFVERFQRRPSEGDPDAERHLRARGALLDALSSMRRACIAHDDPALPFRDVVAVVRRWIESQTFSPRVGRDGVRVLDARAARFAEADAMWVAGLLEGEWPPARSRMAFYPGDLLTELGWPGERPRILADRAMFDDLLASPVHQVALSTVSLEDEAVTRPSVYLDDLDVGALPLARVMVAHDARVTTLDAMLRDPVTPAVVDAGPRDWLEWRLARGPLDDDRFRGDVGPLARDRHTVTALETYLECPFKYFARHVLRLPDEDDEADGLSPRESGRLLHDALERFVRRWDAARANVDDPAAIEVARRLFADVVADVLADVDERDAAVERARLLGSALAIGAGERVIALEFEQPDDAVIGRRLEDAFDRAVTIEAGERARDVRLRGKIDRVDLFADGTFRVVDYKRGNSAPSGTKALQLPIYALAVEQASRETRAPLTVREALYMALGPRGGDSRVITPKKRAEVVAGAEERLLEAVDGIERGEFPPRPRDLHLCARCAFERVCRKEYVSDGEATTA